jgi:hypothetical protein
MLLIRGFLQDPDWDLAHNIDKTYGNWIFGLYLFLTSIILLNLLVALFNSSYTNITDSAEKEYLALFSFKVFSYLKSPDQFPYTAPFNLIEVFLIIPWTVVLSKKAYAKLNRVVMGFLFCIPVLIIARSERKRYWKLKTTDEENRMDKGRRLYYFLTVDDADDTDVDDLFLKATQEHIDDDDDDNIQTRTGADQTATIAQAEEGILAAGSPDLWLSSMSPLESLEEFKVRRAQEKEGKDTKRQSMTNCGSVAVEGAVASGSGSQEQLSSDVVQSLLATLAKLEARQKDMEELLKTFVGESKEDRDLAQARA